jgi:hypothetical protein
METYLNNSKSNLGKKLSKETIEKMHEANSGLKIKDSYRITYIIYRNE